MIDNFIERRGLMFKISRNGETVGEYKGHRIRENSTNRQYIRFYPDSDIDIGDWIISPYDDKYFVFDKETVVSRNQPILRCYVQSEAEYKNDKETPTSIFNIGTAHNSVIGNQSLVNMNIDTTIKKAKEQIATSESPDKEELEQIINLLELMINNQLPPQKGILSKFSDVMERNSWITGSISAAIISWLTAQIH